MMAAELRGTVAGRWRRRPVAPAWLREALSWLGIALVGVAVAGLVTVAMAPRLFGWQFVVVQGGSMEPTIGFGSVAVMTRPDREHLHTGDIVMFSRGGQVVTHRIVAISADGRQLTMKGDANDAPDQGTISPASVRGEFAFAVPKVGYFVHWMGTQQGYMALILIPGLAIIAIELASIGRSLRAASRRPDPGDLAAGGDPQ
ncbi:MAG: signal peptidase I [Chloroflexi bacterium]|nr:signal peptidase I [Chloroflexota bacterium]